MLFNPLPSLLRLGFALICLILLACYGWSLSAQDVPMDLPQGFVLACVSGEGSILLDGRWQRVKPGMVCLAPPRVLNAFEAKGREKWCFAWVRYDEPSFVTPVVGAASPVMPVAQAEEIGRIVNGLRSEWEGEKEPRVFINPEILASSDEMSVYEEGCLSIPEYYEEVERPARVHVRFMDLEGKVREEDAEGLYATCIQHEIDHLNGVLFVDYLSKLKRDRAQVGRFRRLPHNDTTTRGLWSAAGEFSAKYRPGSSTHAAISAMIATNDSVSMPP